MTIPITPLAGAMFAEERRRQGKPDLGIQISFLLRHPEAALVDFC